VIPRIGLAGLVLAADLGGTFLFAVEDALIASQAGLDLLGITVIGFVAALGGGIIRDVLLDAVPPAAIQDARYPLATIAGAAIAILAAPVLHQIPGSSLMVLDAAGLSLFAVAGTQKALARGTLRRRPDGNPDRNRRRRHARRPAGASADDLAHRLLCDRGDPVLRNDPADAPVRLLHAGRIRLGWFGVLRRPAAWAVQPLAPAGVSLGHFCQTGNVRPRHSAGIKTPLLPSHRSVVPIDANFAYRYVSDVGTTFGGVVCMILKSNFIFLKFDIAISNS
jgi:hypothetical protein